MAMHWQDKFQKMQERAIDEIWEAVNPAKGGGRVYLTMRPAVGEAWGVFSVRRWSENLREGEELVTGESFHGGLSRDRIRRMVMDMTRRCPVIGASGF